MKSQPNRDYASNDDVQTPPALAKLIVDHFKPSGKILEPCAGDGNFARLMPGCETCEIKDGRSFFDYHERVDWLITNPPWSQFRPFLLHALSVADNIVFLVTVNHLWTKARVRDIREAGFAIKEILLVDMPPEFPQSGFQLGAIHLQRGWSGPCEISTPAIPISALRGIAPDATGDLSAAEFIRRNRDEWDR